MDNVEFFRLNFWKLPHYVQYFGSNIVEGVSESLVKAGMSWVEVGVTDWSWVDVDRAGWRWMQGLVIRTFKTP